MLLISPLCSQIIFNIKYMNHVIQTKNFIFDQNFQTEQWLMKEIFSLKGTKGGGKGCRGEGRSPGRGAGGKASAGGFGP